MTHHYLKALSVVIAIMFGITYNSYSQVSLTTSPYTESFDAIGSGYPTGWSGRTGANATTLGALASLTSAHTAWTSTGGNFHNSASNESSDGSGTADRVLAVRQTGSFGDPGAAFVLQLANTSNRSAFELTFKLQQLHVTTAGRTVTWIVDYGIGATPTSFTPATTSPATLTTVQGTTQNTTVTVNFGTALDNQAGNVWIRILALNASTGSGTRPHTAIDDVQLSFSTATPNISLSAPNQISAGNVNQGAANHTIQRFQTAITNANATLTEVNFSSNGTYSSASDLSNYRLWYNSVDNFNTATTIATVAAGVTSGNNVVFNTLSQQINLDATGFFWITVDVSASATAGNTLSADNVTLTFASGSQSGTISNPGAQTIQAVSPAIALSSPSPAVAAANLSQNSINNTIYRFDLATTVANTSLTALSVTTNGNYAATGVSNLKAWYSVDATFNAGSDVLLATIANPGTAGVQNFSGFSQLLTSGTTASIFITVDVTCAAVVNATIGVSAITNSDFTTTATQSGTAAAGGIQTFVTANPMGVTNLTATGSSRSVAVSWTAPSGCYDEVMAIVQPVFSTMDTPTGNGNAYTADLNFSGGGSVYGVNGAKVVYKGTNNSITVTGLNNGDSYYVVLFTRLDTNWSAGVNTNFNVDSFTVLNFDDSTKWTQGSLAFTSYSNHSYSDGQVSIQGTSVIRNTTALQDGFAGAFGTYAWRLQNATGSRILITVASGGVRSFKFDARRWDGTPSPDVSINYSTDGGNSWNNLNEINNERLDSSSNWKTFEFIGDVNSPLENIQIEIISNSAGERIMIDNFAYSQRPFDITTWNGSSWSDSGPNLTQNAVVNANLTLNQPIETNQLTVNSGVTLIIPRLYHVTTQGNLINNGTIILESDNEEEHGDLNIRGTISGNPISIEREINGSTNGWRFITSPVSSNINNLGNSVLVTGQANVIRLNTNNPNAWVAQGGAASDALALGKGYAAYFGPSGINGSNVATTITLTGTVNNADVTVSGLSDGNGTNNFGWSLVGNPFPGSVDFDTDHANIIMTNLEPAYYVWDADAGNYYTWHRTSGSSPSNTLNGVMPMGHGFLVKANASSPVLTFRRSALSTESGQIRERAGEPSRTAGLNNDLTQAGRVANITNRMYVSVKHTGDNRKDETLILSSLNATANFESEYDALKAGTLSTTAYSISTQSADGKNLAINGVQDFDGSVSIPVRITGNQPGPMSLEATLIDVNSNTPIILEDLYLNRSHDLRSGAYQYAHIPAQTDRFVIHFQSLTTSVLASSLDQLQVYANDSRLFIKGLETATSLRILDISGRLVYEITQPQFDASGIQMNLTKGTYMVQVITENGTKISKVIF